MAGKVLWVTSGSALMTVWFITSGFCDLAVGARVSTRKVRGVRPLLAAALVLALAVPAAAAQRAALPATVLVTVFVGENATRTMPQALWRKLASEYVGARTVTAEDGPALADEAHCRSAHALYAVLATFERATRLPGLAQDTDRAYGVARFTVRNCVSGIVLPTKTVRLESDPLSEADRGDFEPNAERTWERSVRAALARNPLAFAPAAAGPAGSGPPAGAVGRIIRVDGAVVFIDGGKFSVNQVLRVFADRDARPRAEPIELIVLDVSGKYAQCSVIGNLTPRVGDYVEPAPK
jgi:hypothetical protein